MNHFGLGKEILNILLEREKSNGLICLMKKPLFYLFTLLPCLILAQKQDYTWVIGHDYNFNDDQYGRIVIDFHSHPPTINYLVGDVNMNMFITNVSISDTLGNLLFYSNGCDVATSNGEIMVNGEDINPGEYHTRLCDELGRGYTSGYPGAVILPLPENDSIYYMFHGSVIYIPPPDEDAYVDRFLYSVIKAKTGEKKVVLSKNTPWLLILSPQEK